MYATKIVGAVAGITAVITACSLIVVLYLVNDINNFYDDAIEELTEFKVTVLSS